MGKKKDKDKEKEHGSPSRKKLKKHKKQKKQKKRERLHSDEEIDVVNDDTSQDEGKALKLKIKFGGKTLSEVVTTVHDPVEGNEKVKNTDQSFNSDDLPEDDDEVQAEEAKSDEEQWLEALEKGELDDTGAVKKEKDISVMTARQRALHGEAIEGENELLQLPMYPEKTEEENEEFERKRKLRAKKRKQQMEKQVEETKAQTIEKLLTKGKSTKKEIAKTNKKHGPYFRYTNNKDGVFIFCPDELDFPLEKRIVKETPAAVICSIEGCDNEKKYACSKTNLPVCSLQCYKLINR